MTGQRSDWRKQEEARIAHRRAKCRPQPLRRGPIVGLALSGGGIRSATFSLGLLRALGRAGLIPRIDYLSTVSGGGYIGAFLCSLYVPAKLRGEQDEGPLAPHRVPEDPFSDEAGAFALEHLRQSGRHLMTGAGDAIRLGSIAVRNWLAVQLVIGLSLLTFFFLLKPIKASLLQAEWLLDFEARWLAGNDIAPILWPSQWLQGYSFSRWFIATPLWAFAVLAFLIAAVCGSAHWLTRRHQGMSKARKWRMFSLSGAGAVLSGLVGVALMWRPELLTPRWDTAEIAGALMALLAFGAIVAYSAAHLLDWVGEKNGKPPHTPSIEEDRVRHRLSQWMGRSMAIALAIAALALLDSVAQTLYLRADELWLRVAQAGFGLAFAVPAVRWVYRALQGEDRSKIGRLLARFGQLVALITAVLLGTAVGLFWAILAHALAWQGGPVGRLDAWYPHAFALGALFLLLGLLAAASFCLAYCWGFLNLSSFASFYAGRLRRAYLGASNRDRVSGPEKVAADRDHANDDVSLGNYYADTVLAPLHLINVTVNDTTGSSSNLTQRDRRGRPLVISSAGYLHPIDAIGSDCDRIAFGTPENLPLSTWMGISGAAFSTGIGQHGSLGLSLLAGLANLRLGYWWEARPQERQAILTGNVQNYLRREMLGRFTGTDEKRWYLSDGGHFENTGAYELVRRQVPLIIAADCGADPDYAFADVIRLMRLIRIDFGAELTFLGEDELKAVLGENNRVRDAFTTLRGLRKQPGKDEAPSRFGPYAALGRIRYPGKDGEVPPVSTFLLIKPRVCRGEMPDLLAYADAHPLFPQETTADQFFDEAQWESYYRLGELIGDHVFADDADQKRGHWRPRDLQPLGPPA